MAETETGERTVKELTSFPPDAILSRGFFEALPGYRKGPVCHDLQKPNWSGETVINGQAAEVIVSEYSDFGVRIAVRTADREEVWVIDEHSYDKIRGLWLTVLEFSRRQVTIPLSFLLDKNKLGMQHTPWKELTNGITLTSAGRLESEFFFEHDPKGRVTERNPLRTVSNLVKCFHTYTLGWHGDEGRQVMENLKTAILNSVPTRK